MGTAAVRCVRGCSCAPATLDGHRSADAGARWVSVYTTETIALRLHAAACRVEVEVLGATRSGGHKFKIGELALRWRGEGGSRAPCV
mmetsp:Transcript_1575/g.3339  ORF Transcript_1575/g.3339 Transcript_1575/m.3339 type:complete len:87 (+) Transcript_1575:2-262(+)